MIVTLDQLRSATGATPANAQKYLDPLNTAMQLYGINTKERVAGFLSQIGHESGALSRVVENLNYRVDALLSLFSRQRISEDDARAYGRNDAIKQPADQESLANILYGGVWGAKNLGNTEYGDGWQYRGRGLKQLTGRYNYKVCGEALGIDLVDNPELLEQPLPAALSAAWFWRTKNLDQHADNQDIEKLTRAINGGTLGLDERKRLFAAAMTTLDATA
jgi:putative chitinase